MARGAVRCRPSDDHDEGRARPGDRLRGLHRHARGARLLAEGGGDGRRQFRSLLRCHAQGSAPRAACGHAGFPVRADRSRRRRSRRRPFRDGRSATSYISRRSRACAIRCRIPKRTCATTCWRSATCSKGAATPGRASRLCVELAACTARTTSCLLRGPERRPSGEPVRRDEESQRADGAQLQPSYGCRRRGCVSSRSTGPGDVRTCRRCCSPRRSSPARRSMFTTTATCGAISPMSTISSRASSGC